MAKRLDESAVNSSSDVWASLFLLNVILLYAAVFTAKMDGNTCAQPFSAS